MEQTQISWRTDGLSRTPQGYLRIQGYATISDAVLTYTDTGGEYRPPEEVNRQDSLDTLKNIPITWGHPVQNGKRVHLDPKNTGKFIKGYTTDNVSIEGDLVKVEMIITDGDLITEIEAGKIAELSPGYDRFLDKRKGAAKGMAFDGIQRSITYNHLAVVNKGRSGSRVRLITDEEDNFMITINGKTYESAEAAQLAVDTALAAEKARADAAESKVDAEKARADEAEAQLAESNKRADAFDSTINSKVAELVALRTEAAKHLPKEFKFDGLNEVEIKSAVITARHDGLSLEGKSPEYINARYDAIIELPVIDKQSRVDSAIEAVGKGSSGQLNFNPVLAARQANNNKRLGA